MFIYQTRRKNPLVYNGLKSHQTLRIEPVTPVVKEDSVLAFGQDPSKNLMTIPLKG